MGDIFGSSILTNILLIFILMSALYIAGILIDLIQEVNDGREDYLNKLRKMIPVKDESHYL